MVSRARFLPTRIARPGRKGRRWISGIRTWRTIVPGDRPSPANTPFVATTSLQLLPSLANRASRSVHRRIYPCSSFDPSPPCRRPSLTAPFPRQASLVAFNGTWPSSSIWKRIKRESRGVLCITPFKNEFEGPAFRVPARTAGMPTMATPGVAASYNDGNSPPSGMTTTQMLPR